MDDCDYGSEYADFYLTVAMKNHIGPAGGDPAEICGECGDEISEGRRLAVPGCRLCVECQTRFESDRVARTSRREGS